jgi:tetratricopeptide (TPR) repeat protein
MEVTIMRRGSPAWWFSGAWLLIAAPVQAETPIVWDGVVDPHIRAAQYDALMGKPFDGITQLLADRAQQRVKQQPEQAEWVLGGMYLTHGSHRVAAKIFHDMKPDEQPQDVRDLAWYNLGEVQYQRGLDDEALASFARIKGALPGEARQGRLLMESVLLMRRGRFDEAVSRLEQLGQKSLVQSLSEKSVWATYGRFNLGVALYKVGRVQEGESLLQELGEFDGATAEVAALRDKANLTLAFHYLDQDKPADAERYFMKARLNGPLSDQALLGLGRVYSQKEEHKKSLVPWLNLAKRDASDAAVQDALLAVPFAFGRLDAYKQALEYYDQALQAFKAELERLDAAETEIRSGAMMESLVRKINPQTVTDNRILSELPDAPAVSYLWSMLSTDEFQEALKNYAHLRLALGRLEQWSAQTSDEFKLTPAQRKDLTRRITDLEVRVVQTTDEVRDHLQTMALLELERRKRRVLGYADEARFSMAQIYDYAAKRWGGKQ